MISIWVAEVVLKNIFKIKTEYGGVGICHMTVVVYLKVKRLTWINISIYDNLTF